MGKVSQKCEENECEINGTTAARVLHPEDIRLDDELAVWEASYQFPSFFWCSTDVSLLPPNEPIQIRFLSNGEFDILRVKSICLPFVLCKKNSGDHQVIDVRLTRLVRVNSEFAQLAWDHLGSSNPNRKKKSKRKRRKKKRNK